MGILLEHFWQQKMNAASQLAKLADLYKELELYSEIPVLQELKQQLDDESFQVAVVGEFSRGKSMFINALLGRRVLPSNTRPTTTILNRIVYADQPIFKLYYHNPERSPKLLNEAEFKKLVAPKEPDPDDTNECREYEKSLDQIRSIQHAEIGYPIEFCKHGVEIIDTPGTNELDPMREQITNQLIPQSDAAILLLSAAKALSASEMSFLRDRLLGSDIQKIFIVLNFKDLLDSQEDYHKVLKHTRDHLKESLGWTPRIFMVSAKEALNARRIAAGEQLMQLGEPVVPWAIEDSGMPSFEAELIRFLAQDRGAVKLGKPLARALKSIEEVASRHLKLERGAITRSISDLNRKVEAFRPQFAKAIESGNEAKKKFEQEIKKQEEENRSWYDQELQRLKQTKLDLFDKHYDRSKEKMLQAIEENTAAIERQLFLDRRDRMMKASKSVLRRAGSDVGIQLQEIHTGIERLFSPAQGGEDESLALVPIDSFVESSVFDYILSDLSSAFQREKDGLGRFFIGTGIAVTALVGGIFSLFKNIFSEENEIRKNQRKQFEVYLSDYRSQQAKEFENEWAQLKKEIGRRVDKAVKRQVAQSQEQLKTLEQAAKRDKSEASAALAEIDRRVGELDRIQSEIRSLHDEMANSGGKGDLEYVR